MGDSHDVKKEIGRYYKVFAALIILTIVTVAISKFHFALGIAIFLGLLVATTKASLVASIFMHLISERKVIYIVMSLTAFFFLSMLLLIFGGNYSVPERTKYLNHEIATTTDPHHTADAGHGEQHMTEEEGAHH